MYVIFTIITGCFNAKIEGFPNELHVINGVFEMLQLFLQLCFISSLKLKESLDHNPNYQQPHRNMPGRQVSHFLKNIFLNFDFTDFFLSDHDFPLSIQPCPMVCFYL